MISLYRSYYHGLKIYEVDWKQIIYKFILKSYLQIQWIKIKNNQDIKTEKTWSSSFTNVTIDFIACIHLLTSKVST